MPYFEDKLGDYELLAMYCIEHGLKVNFVISELISREVKKLKLKEKDS